MIRNSHIFAPAQPQKLAEVVLRGPVIEVSNPSKELDVSKDATQIKEENEFLKMIRRSNYKMDDQLHENPSEISILSLLLNLEAHMEALLKVLTQAHLAQSITVDEFDGVVSNIKTCCNLSFNDKDLP